MTDVALNNQPANDVVADKEVDFNEAVAQAAQDNNLNAEVTGEGVELTPEQYAKEQQRLQEERLKAIVDGFNSETEDDYRNRVVKYIDYLEVRNKEVSELLLGDLVITNPNDEPLIDMDNQAVVDYIQVQPAIEVLASFGKLPIYFNELRHRIEDTLVSIQYKLASICKLSDEVEQQNLKSIDNSLVYGVTMLFTLQSSNVLKTLVNYHRDGVLDETNRNVYLEALDKNYQIHKDYLTALDYKQALPVLDGHYEIVKRICLELPVVAEIKRKEDATETVTE